MNLFLKEKINPLIGSAGVSAVPMAARVSQMVGQKEKICCETRNPANPRIISLGMGIFMFSKAIQIKSAI